MSWQMPAQGQWPPAMAMAPDMMNVGSYTPDQWAALQQNWQQWAQWQQQYAQWQNQYGEKYAQQMQVMQSAGAAPPCPPTSAPPPAPPPPDNPPPPPHENNQPLFGSTSTNPTPVPPPNQNRTSNPSNLTSVNIATGNSNQWSFDKEPQQSAVNSEALRKLAEEEKLFDIQFQKWEEEIDKWRKENVNHPDKEAYKEYEAKFEACRAQLLERRQQMNQKKARLLSNAPAGPTAGNKPPAVPPPPIKNTANMSYNQNQSQGYNNRPDYQNQSQNFNKKPDQNYSNPNASYHHYNEPPPVSGYNRPNRGNVDPQDRYESYEDMDSYTTNDYPPTNSTFLPTSGGSKNIPGLDLVPETDKNPPVNKQQDVIDITDDNEKKQPKGPDYSTISKGINNILGDEKIMNILSTLQGGQNASDANMPHNAPYNNYSNQNMPSNNQWNRNDNFNNQQYGNRQNNMPHNNRQDQNYSMQQNNSMQQGNRMQQNRQMQQNQPLLPNHQMQQNHSMQQNHPMHQNHHMQQNQPMQQNQGMHKNNPMQQNRSLQQNQDQNRFPPNHRRMYDEGQGDSEQDMYYNNSSQFGGSNMPQKNDQGQGDSAPHPRPLLDLPVHPPNNFQRGPLNRGPPPNVPRNPPPPAPRPKWMDEPLFTPSFIVEYEHKPLRLKARDFIEPVHMFDYHHKSKDGDNKKKDFEREADEIFARKPRRDRENEYPPDRFDNSDRHRDLYTRDFERRVPRDEFRERNRPMRDEFEDRRRPDDRYEERRRDDRDKYTRREDFRERDRERERERERDRDRERDFHRDRFSRDTTRRDEVRHRSRSRDRDSRKRDHSRESQVTDPGSKKARESEESDKPKHIVMIDDILETPGREMRPEKIVIILRGPPGSGKSYLAKLIRDREAEYGGTARIMSIDDYFMQEGEVEEKDPATGKVVKKPTLKYEYDEKQEEVYLNSLKRAFKRSLTDGYFTFLIYDAVNDHLRSYADIWNFARQNGFQVYVCTMELDPQICHKRNIHGRSLEDVQVVSARFFPTPPHHIALDASTLLQAAAITDVHMEDASDDVVAEDVEEPQVETVFTSKWERMDDAAQLAKLDGTSKPLRPSQLSMEDYLQLDDWTPSKAKPGKKSVRWADIEERRQQEKMRAIGFVVGQTDWTRMTDPTMGSGALTQTKYIERVRRT